MAEKGEHGDMLPRFYVPRKVLNKFRSYGAHGDDLAEEWDMMVEDYCAHFKDKEPEVVKDLQDRLQGRYLAQGWKEPVQQYLTSEHERINAGLKILLNDPSKADATQVKKQPSEKFKHKAGRVCATEVLKQFVEFNPCIMGGSGDVGSSCGGHFPKLQGMFLPPAYASKLEGAGYEGRYINFGIREHACLAILNGLSSYSGIIPYCTLFTIFFQYGLPAMKITQRVEDLKPGKWFEDRYKEWQDVLAQWSKKHT